MSYRPVLDAGLCQFQRDHTEAARHEIVFDLVLAVNLGPQELAAVGLEDAKQQSKNGRLANAIGRVNDVVHRQLVFTGRLDQKLFEDAVDIATSIKIGAVDLKHELSPL